MFKIKEENNSVIVTPNENVVAGIVNEFRGEMKKHVDKEKDITVNLENVEMIDSMGLGALIATHNSMQKYHKRLGLVNISKDLLTLLKTMRLDQHFEIK